MYDLPLRGQENEDGTFRRLLDFRVDSGDKILKDHLENGRKNAKYISPQSQNELIKSCEIAIREKIVKAVNKAKYFSVLADETCDISGTEQLSIVVRFLDRSGGKAVVREEFLGYAKVEDMSAKSIAALILKKLTEYGLDLNGLVGQGYDGCSAMFRTFEWSSSSYQSSLPKSSIRSLLVTSFESGHQ